MDDTGQVGKSTSSLGWISKTRERKREERLWIFGLSGFILDSIEKGNE